MKVTGIDHVVFTVTDVEASVRWYVELLGLGVERLEEWRGGQALFVSLRIDPTTLIDLFPGEPTGGGADHVALVVEEVDLDELAASLGDAVEMGPVQLWGARGNGRGIYVKDPDGNRIELRTYAD